MPTITKIKIIMKRWIVMINSRLPTVATHGDGHSNDDDKAVKHILNTDLKNI